MGGKADLTRGREQGTRDREIGHSIGGSYDRLAGFVRTKEALAVEMDQVRRRISDPYLCLPCDLAEVSAHHRTVRERRDVDQTYAGHCEKTENSGVPLAVNGAVACNRFNEKQPITLGVIQHDIRHLAVRLDFNAKFRERCAIDDPHSPVSPA